jgi:hypothetical protein
MPVCGGFDGSDTADWTGIRLETIDGYQFTPTFGPDKKPTIWNPAEHGGKIPRLEVATALEDLFATYEIERFYCDPFDWKTEIESWALKYGDEHLIQWDTGRGHTRVTAVFYALERYKIDISTGALSSDDCPVTRSHMANARKIPKPGEKYTIGKPGNQDQKIDMAVVSVLCHEAACDARAAGWKPPEPRARMTIRR